MSLIIREKIPDFLCCVLQTNKPNLHQSLNTFYMIIMKGCSEGKKERGGLWVSLSHNLTGLKGNRSAP